MSKQFGLIVPDKSKKPSKVANIFGDSSSDDDSAPKKKPRTTDVSQIQKKLAQKLQEQALAEDPNIFQYDEVYDEIENKRKEEKQARKSAVAQGPKYIGKLLETAEKRKKEHERRVERQVQKEREAEGEQFKDKDSFVTSAYRKKLEEMKEAEEAEKREAYLESIGDVTKQQNMDGFYRHLYEQKMAPETKSAEQVELKTVETNKKKNYRKRKSSADQNSENEQSEVVKPETSEKAHIVSNLDADSDFSIDSSDSEDEKKTEKEPEESKDVKIEIKEKSEEPSPVKEKPEAESEVKIEEAETIEPPKPKIDIWKKRTVGEAFDQALQKYYERKAAREAA